MKIFDASQIRAWDQYTILHEPIRSIDLMERAANSCFQRIVSLCNRQQPFFVCCGTGNNGGDGLAIARMLVENGFETSTFICQTSNHPSEEFNQNLERLMHVSRTVFTLKDKNEFPRLKKNEIVIDALIGTGLKKQPEGLLLELIQHINRSKCFTIAIDIPSGLFMDELTNLENCIRADHTLTFQCMKKTLLLPSHLMATCSISVLDIGLSKDYYEQTESIFSYNDESQIKKIYRPRIRSGHKGTFGHALTIAGSFGKMGAAILSTKASLRVGAGLATAYVPGCGVEVLQTALPEAMVAADDNLHHLSAIPDTLHPYDAIGIGPGIGTKTETINALEDLLKKIQCPLVLDADALNCLSLEKKLLDILPPNTLLTPHPKEFDRLFGASQNELDRLERARMVAIKHRIILILKGPHTLIALPDGSGIFNSSGNAGMATAGSGDVLTGMLTGLLANRYSPENAAILGVFLHGLAGDLAATKHSQESMIAGDFIEKIGKAFHIIAGYK